MTRSRRASAASLGALALTIALTSYSANARADEADEAVAHFNKGVQLYDDENYEGALVEFETAYQASHNYKLLYNIGICQTLLKDFPAAVRTFTRYLEEGGTDIAAPRKAEIQDRLSKLAQQTTPVKIATNAPGGSQVTIDDLAIGDTPLPDTVPVKIGRRVFAITSNGRTVSKTVDVVSGQTMTVDLQFKAGSVALRDTDAPAAKGPSLPWIWFGLTGAAGVAAIVTGEIAVSKRNDFNKAQATFGVSKSTLEDDRNSARNMGIVTDCLLGVTVVGAAVSTYFTVDYFKKKKQLTTGFYVTPFGAGYARSF